MSSSSSPRKGNAAYQHLLSGGLSGFASGVSLQPLDLLKTRVQQADRDILNRRFGGTFHIAKQIIATEGPLGLWRGTTPTIVRNVPGVAVYFYTLQHVRHLFSTLPYFSAKIIIPSNGSSSASTSALPRISNQANLYAGAATRVAVGFVLNPFSVIKARFESNAYAYKSVSGAFMSIIQTSGPRGLMQGFTATAIRDAPYAGLFVLLYEAMKDWTARLTVSRDASSKAFMFGMSSVTAGTIATLVTHPFDMLKTKMQIQPKTHPTLRRAIVTVLKERGLVGFFDGASLRLSRKVLSSAIAWTVYESLLLVMRDFGRS